MKAYRMTYHSQKNGTIQIVTMGKDMIDVQAQAAGWAHATSLAANEEIELVAIAKLDCKRAEFDPRFSKSAQKAEYRDFGKITKQAPRPRQYPPGTYQPAEEAAVRKKKRAQRIPAEYRVDFAKKREAQFACQECGRKFKSRRAAERASWSGCPGCGATDIDLA